MSQKPYAASYNIFSNRLFLWVEKTRDPERRLSPEDYEKVNAVPGMVYWGGRGAFTCLWSPAAEDLITQVFEMEIEERDEPDDVEGRVNRFEKYAENDERDAGWARERLHNASTARRARLAEASLTKKVNEAAYWHDRIAGAIRHALHRESPDVIRKRIKDLQKHNRKMVKLAQESEKWLAYWERPEAGTDHAAALRIAGGDPLHYSMKFLKEEYPNSTYEGELGIWSALRDNTITASQAQEIMIREHEKRISQCHRWLAHNMMRVEYWTAYLGEDAAEPEREPDALPFEKGKWIIENGCAYRIIRVNQDDVAVAMDNRYGYFKYAKSGIRDLFTYEQIVEFGTPLGSPLEDKNSELEFESGKYAVTDTRALGGRETAHKIKKVGRTQLVVEYGNHSYTANIRKAEVKELITEEEARERKLIQ